MYIKIPPLKHLSYLDAGYSAVIVTVHYSRDTFRYLGIGTSAGQDKVDSFLTGYRMVKAEGEKRGLKVYRGAEVRFDGGWNDYLLYSYSDALLRDPETIFTMGVEAFYERCKADGPILVHAHPYRNAGKPSTSLALDGVEVFNANMDQDERNPVARTFAQINHLLITAGSDCHGPKQVGKAGSEVHVLLQDENQLAALLKSGDYSIFGN